MNTGRVVTVEERPDGYLWVRLCDEITVDNYHTVEEVIRGHLAGLADKVVLDLTGVRHIYSSGLGFIVRLQKTVASRNGIVCLVNVDARLRTVLEDNNLDRLLPIYATDVEWQVSRSDAWHSVKTRRMLEFFFITQTERGVCHINIAGHMDSLHDLSRLDEFHPDPTRRYYLINLDSLETMDTYGSQVFLELIERIGRSAGICVACGASSTVRELLALLSIDILIEMVDTEIEALQRIERYRSGERPAP